MIHFANDGRALVVFQLRSHPAQQMSIDLGDYLALLKLTTTEAEFRAALLGSPKLTITSTEEHKAEVNTKAKVKASAAKVGG